MDFNEEIRFVKKGNKIIVKKTIPDREWSYKDVLENLSYVDQAKAKAEEAIAEIEESINTAKENIENQKEAIRINDERRKKLAKFEADAKLYQEKLLKEKVGELRGEVIEKVKAAYVFDKALTPEQNDNQMFAQYQKYLSAHPEIVEKVTNSVITSILFKTDFLDHPFKGFSK